MNTDQIAADIAREGSIRRLANQMKVELLLENDAEQRRLFDLMLERVQARSQAQVERMERAGGLQP